MEETKPFWKSWTVLGAVVAILPNLYEAAVTLLPAATVNDINTRVGQASAILGGVMSVLGRISATKRIG